MEFITRYLNLSTVMNFILISMALYFIVRHLIPTYFAKKNEESHKDFEALVRQKKMELTSTTLDLEEALFSKNISKESKSEFLKFIDTKFPRQTEFYKNLEQKAGWQEGIIGKDFLEKYSDLLPFNMQFQDVKKVLHNASYEIVHRGDYEKVLLLIWLEKLIYCLKMDQPLPRHSTTNVYNDLSLWRWSLLRMTLGNGHWQSLVFDNLSLINDHRSEILSTKNLLDFTKNHKIWWEKLKNYILQIEAFLPIDEKELMTLKNKDVSKKEKLQFLKRYHPDTISWEIIHNDHRAIYEPLLNENFIKINETLKE
jgi:hypothetical protein